MNTKNTVKVTILGDQYSLVTDQSQEQVKLIADHVDKLMAEIKKRLVGADAKMIAVLVAIQLANELFECQEQLETDQEHCKRLISLIDRRVQEDSLPV